jgi:hypothetical protein
MYLLFRVTSPHIRHHPLYLSLCSKLVSCAKIQQRSGRYKIHGDVLVSNDSAYILTQFQAARQGRKARQRAQKKAEKKGETKRKKKDEDVYGYEEEGVLEWLGGWALGVFKFLEWMMLELLIWCGLAVLKWVGWILEEYDILTEAF